MFIMCVYRKFYFYLATLNRFLVSFSFLSKKPQPNNHLQQKKKKSKESFRVSLEEKGRRKQIRAELFLIQILVHKSVKTLRSQEYHHPFLRLHLFIRAVFLVYWEKDHAH